MAMESHYPEKRGAQKIRGPLAQPTIINLQRVATGGWLKMQMLFNLH